MESLFSLPSEYQALRESVRALAESKIAPAARDVDESARYPREAAIALQGAGLAAAHVPEEFGGEGADALGVVIIIEEVARVCGSSSLIPAVNKLGSLPVLLAGTSEQKKRWLTPLAKGQGFSYCLSESEAGSDAAAMRTKAVRKDGGWVLSGSKKWISNAGESDFTQFLPVQIVPRAQKESQHLLWRRVIQESLSAHMRRRWVFAVHLPVKSILMMFG